MRYTLLKKGHLSYIRQAAHILADSFLCYSDMHDALEEVENLFDEGNFGIVAVDDHDHVAGIIGGQPAYDGNVYELHPLAVRGDMWGQGIGRELVDLFELTAEKRGAVTAYLGTDDEDDETTLSGCDIYEDTYNRIETIQNNGQHPYEFYQKCGYKIVGVVPDANGNGKPDIMMAKRLGK